MKKLKKLMSLLLALTMTMSLLSTAAFAEETTDGTVEELPPTATKSATLLDRYANRYNVTIQVPGQDGQNKHDEVIVMMDGSYSGDEEWPQARETILAIGKAVLNGNGNTQLTVMAFGMADNIVVEHVKDNDALAKALPENLPGGLLYGRSSTNCEAGFTGVAEYIEAHDDTLNAVHVVYISDGRVNTDETPRVFDANWQTWTKFGALAVAQETFGGAVSNGKNLPAAFATVFGDRFADAESNDDIINLAFGGKVSDEEFLAFAEQIWTDVYAYSGLTRGNAYPISDVERAFIKYDKEHDTYIQDLFYYSIYQSSYVTYPDRWTRTPLAGNALAGVNKVLKLHMVDTDNYTAWMDPKTGEDPKVNVFGDKVSLTHNLDDNDWAGSLKEVLTKLAYTPFNDVVVTDYMSKWVNLDATTLKIVDSDTDEVIWTAKDGWKSTENRPTAKEPPVVVEKVDPADYEAGGAAVVGNTSGDIYKLTWNVKDGAMLRADNYRLEYEVTVDTEETGFRYDTDYPANGNTTLEYTDRYDERQEDPIKVPDVNAVDLKYYTGDYYEHGANGDPTTTPLTQSQAEKVVEDGTITMSKTIKQLVEEENGYEITLNVVSEQNLKEVEISPDSAVVLVVDTSGSMQYRLDGGGWCREKTCGRYTKEATGCPWQHRWGIDPSIEGEAANITRFKFAADGLESFLNDYEDGTDGKRMLSIVYFGESAVKEQDWIDVNEGDNLAAAQSKVTYEALSANPRTNTAQGTGLAMAADLLKADAVKDISNRYVIMLTDGRPENDPTGTAGTVENENGSHGTAMANLIEEECKAIVQVIGFGTGDIKMKQTTTTGYTYCNDWLENDVATEPKYFIPANSFGELDLGLTTLYEQIASGASLYNVIDPMGDYIDFVAFSGSTTGASYDAGSETLRWDLKQATPVVTKVGDDTIYTYTLKYTVYLDVHEKGCTLDDEHPANKATSLTYAKLSADGTVAPNAKIETAYFNLPSVYATITGPHASNATEPEAAAVMTLSMEAGSADAVSCFLIDENENVTATSATTFSTRMTSVAIPSEEDSVSAVYVQKADTGMLWTSERVSADVLDELIDTIEGEDLCDKHGKDHKNHHDKNNKDKKDKIGAIVSGEGSFELKYREGKENKRVTYTFEVEDNDQDCKPNCGNKHHGHHKNDGSHGDKLPAGKNQWKDGKKGPSHK